MSQADGQADRATSPDVLSDWVRDARCRSLRLIADLDDQQLMVPQLPIVNPLLWEIGHAAWFQERWVLQHAAGKKPIHDQGASLFDSIAIQHSVRWDLPLPSRAKMLRYVQQVRDAVVELLDQGEPDGTLTYFVKLAVFHEDMHTEAFTYTRQTLAYPTPNFNHDVATHSRENGRFHARADVALDGGVLELGAPRDAEFVFDNEQWAHTVRVEPFAISPTAVSQSEFASFVDDGGYHRREFWSEEGWRWRTESEATHPVYWKHEGSWLCRHFDQWQPLEPQLPVIHVNWFEANAYCRWSRRRLPTESEWEFAAAGDAEKRHYPWGESPPTPVHANLDWRALGPVDTRACAAGDSHCGCRQLIGNVWEWTATTFRPYPGFEAGPYKEYSQPGFGQCKVLRGGCWATRARLMRNTWRNFFAPHRRDIFAGFRTCAI